MSHPTGPQADPAPQRVTLLCLELVSSFLKGLIISLLILLLLVQQGFLLGQFRKHFLIPYYALGPVRVWKGSS